MEAPRRTRADETREASSRPVTWEPAASLPEPAPREGWVHRWCASSVTGQTHVTGMNNSLQQGWIPVKAEEYPEVTSRVFGHSGKGQIEYGGLTLCRMPKEMADARQAYYDRKNRTEMAGVRSDLASQSGDRRYGAISQPTLTQSYGRQLDFGSGE